jgi:hypothetical protein
VVADAGRASAAAQVQALLDAGTRVLAVDPFYFGESKIATRDFLFAILIAALGERPLGVQSGQIMAAARWLQRERGGEVRVAALGPRTSLAALIAAALEERAIAGLSLDQPFSSLKDILTQDLVGNRTPELFCFGLLEAFDIPAIQALVAPRAVDLVK